MCKRLKRVAAALFAVLYFSCASCFSLRALAADTPSYTTDSNLWHWAQNNGFSRALTLHMLPYIASTDVCANSSDSKHHASSVTGVSDGGYYICVCENCGNEFTSSTLAGDVYNDYSASLPAQEINSSGGFTWRPSLSDVVNIKLTLSHNGNSFAYTFSGNSIENNYFELYSDADGYRLAFNCSSSTGHAREFYINSLKFDVPVSGVYSLLRGTCFTGVYMNFDGSQQVASSVSWNAVSDVSCFVSPLVINMSNFRPITVQYYNKCQGFIYLPSFSCVPQNPFNVSSSSSNEIYNINTRAATISGDYGMITQSGDIQKIDSQTIVNEGAKTYYSPTTGETTSFTDWTYDYSDRSYTLTTTSGDTTTVTYGDEYCTVREGDTITNIYYLNENPADNPSGENNNGNGSGVLPHFHNYIGTVTVEPDCTVSGVKTFACSCGDSYTQTIQPSGHMWTVKTRVPTEYDDETSELLVQGYTVYRCSVCGEEYKSVDGSSPPGGYTGNGGDSGGSGDSGGTIWGKLGTLLGTIALAPLKVIESLIGVILDGLISLAQVITEGLATLLEMVAGWFDLIPGLFAGFIAFLSAVFAFLPQEMVMLLTFGLACVVFIGIIRAVRGR